MVEAVADDTQRLVALNEIYLGAAGHQTARYRLGLEGDGGVVEAQARPGCWWGRAPGPTGWLRSLWQERGSAPAAARPTEDRLLWFVREAWPSPATGTSLVAGELLGLGRPPPHRRVRTADRVRGRDGGGRGGADVGADGAGGGVRGAVCGWWGEAGAPGSRGVTVLRPAGCVGTWIAGVAGPRGRPPPTPPPSQPRVHRLRLQGQHPEHRLVDPPQRLALGQPVERLQAERVLAERERPLVVRKRPRSRVEVLRAGVLRAVDDPQVLAAAALDAGLDQPALRRRGPAPRAA